MFIIDKQTQSDLSVFKREDGLCELFDTTRTVGGAGILREFFYSPLSSVLEIQSRQRAIQYMAKINLEQFLDKFMFDDLESYLRLPNEPYSASKIAHYIDNLSIAPASLRYQRERLLISRSISEIAGLIVCLKNIFDNGGDEQQDDLVSRCGEVVTHFDILELDKMLSKKISLEMVIKYDYIFRNSQKSIIREVFDIFYELDALQGIAIVSEKMQLTFPIFEQDGDAKHMLVINGSYNPFLKNPVKNDVCVEAEKNIWFLTGANMTGKSTILKTIGIAVYLAHIGFPVPADSMITRFHAGLLTTINLGDDIKKGHSHFFSEIFRLKFMAETLQSSGRIVVIVDELFKGTNYDDAYQATVELLGLLANYKDSIFLISSHLTDVVKDLECNRIDFKYLLTHIRDDRKIDFTYKLETGIARERLGMKLLEGEKIFELLRNHHRRSAVDGKFIKIDV